jgi:hypothetical protein
MSYAYHYATNSVNKYETIQEDISDAYAYLDDEVVEDSDDLTDDLTDEQVEALLAEMAEVA